MLADWPGFVLACQVEAAGVEAMPVRVPPGPAVPGSAPRLLEGGNGNWDLADRFLDRGVGVIGFAGISGDTGGTIVPTATPGT